MNAPTTSTRTKLTRLHRSRGPGLRAPSVFARIGLIVGLLVLVTFTPRTNAGASSTAVSGMPLSTSGVHFGMVFNNYENTLNGYKTGEAGIDYVYGADSGMHNIPDQLGHAWHDKYLSWSRDAAWGASQTVAWYKQYHPDWLLYKSDHTTVPIAMGDNIAPLDFTNPAVQQYIVNTWINPALAGGFQGVVFDNDLGFNYLGAAGHYDSSGTWVQQYTGSWNDDTYANAQAAAFQQIVSAVHASHPNATVSINQGVDCNDTLSQNEAGMQYANITTMEQGFTNSANGSLPYIAQYANQYCPNGKWLTVMQFLQHLQRDLGEGLFILNPEPYAVSAYQTDTSSQARFDLQWTLANYLLINYGHTYMRWGDSESTYGQPLIQQHEYTAVQAIGSPTNDFYASQNVYMRDFTGGLSVVNPDRYTGYTVSFPAGKYLDLYGNPVTSVTMPAHSGLVLLSAPNSAPTATSTPLPTATNTPAPTATNTSLPTATNTPLPTATDVPVPTSVSTAVPTATKVPVPTATNTPVATATNTTVANATKTPVPTATSVPSRLTTILTDSPLAFYRLNETSGSTAVDSSSHGLNGSYGQVTQGVSGLTGDGDRAVGLSGTTSSYVSTAMLPKLSGSFSIEAWVLPQQTGTPYQALLSTSAHQYLFGYRNSTHQFAINFGSSDTYTYATTHSYPTGTRVDVVYTYDATTQTSTLYVNGVADGRWTGTQHGITPNWEAGVTRLGGIPNSAYPSPLKGTVDDVGVYTQALTATQVLTHYRGY